MKTLERTTITCETCKFAATDELYPSLNLKGVTAKRKMKGHRCIDVLASRVEDLETALRLAAGAITAGSLKDAAEYLQNPRRGTVSSREMRVPMTQRSYLSNLYGAP